MAKKDDRVTEAEVGIAVLRILANQPKGIANVKTLKIELPKLIKLTAADQEDSLTRSNEELWEQQVRNLRSHKNTEGNIFAEGLVEWVRRGVWRITDSGHLNLKHNGY